MEGKVKWSLLWVFGAFPRFLSTGVAQNYLRFPPRAPFESRGDFGGKNELILSDVATIFVA